MNHDSDGGTRPKSKPRLLASGRVGIFWHYQGILLTASVPLDNGVVSTLAVNGPCDHITTWPQFQRQVPTLASMEYEEVPRGRVLFLKRSRKYFVYMDKVLMTGAVKKAVRKAFKLPSTTLFKCDPHYVTDPDDLDRIFGSD